MSNNPLMFVDVYGNTKSFDFSPWGGIEGFLEASKTGAGGNYKAVVPDVLRAVDMTGTAVSSLPFEVCDKAGNVIDSSGEWKNKAGGIDNPKRLLYLIASSLCGGAAYALKDQTPRAMINVQYCAPHTIAPYIDINGLQYFDRSTQQGKYERIMPENMLYFWLPDSDVEVGPALSHPLGTAAGSANLSMNMTNSLSSISQRGFIPPTVLAVSGGSVQQGEKEKIETWWNSWLKNAFSQLVKVINGDKVEIKQVGAGMEQLKGTFVELKREAKEDISQAFGIPSGLFMSDNAFATEFNALVRMWYSSSIFVTIYKTIEETLNNQWLNDKGYYFYFRPDALDIFQTDEAIRATAVSSLVSAVDKSPKVARFVMGFLGYDFSDEQEAQLDEIVNEKDKAAQDMGGKPEIPQTAKEETKPEELVEEMRSVRLTAPMLKDLKTWADMSLRFMRKGKSLPIDFECKSLSDSMADEIRDKLRVAKNEGDVLKAFEIENESPKISEILALADAINKAVENDK